MSTGQHQRKNRRRAGGVLGGVSLLLSLVGIVVVVGFVVSRVLTDRFGWSQWVWWVPGMWWVVGVWGLWAMSGVIGWVSVVRGGRYGRRVAVRRVLLVGCLGVSVFVLIGVQRWYRVIGGDAGIEPERSAQQRAEDLRVVHWNIAGGEVDEGAFERLVDWLDADVVLVANARWDGQRELLRDGLMSRVGTAGVDDGWGGSLSIGQALVVSRFRVSASVVYLGLAPDEEERGVRGTGRYGWVAMVTVHRGEEEGGDVLVWLVDSPSEPTALRREMFEMMAGKIDERIDQWEDARKAGRVVLPVSEWGVVDRPALLIGDFNTPRGSGSLGVFDRFEGGDGFDDAFVQSGVGPARSWVPEGRNVIERFGIAIADWHIDLALTGNGWEAGGYGVFRSYNGRALGGSHGVQVVDLVGED
ncbi:MAG: endonuclease/exonuclease/phosphatase family protein [Phycisphaerales bacterium]